MRHSDARRKLNHAVAKGLLVRPVSCQRCGRIPSPRKDGKSCVQGHHHDYSKPLDVEWLCPTCHRLDDPVPRGEHNGQSRLNDAAVVSIYRLRSKGLTHQAIADRFGVDRKTISRVLNGIHWRHV